MAVNKVVTIANKCMFMFMLLLHQTLIRTNQIIVGAYHQITAGDYKSNFSDFQQKYNWKKT